MKIRAGIQIGRLTAADSLGRGGDGTTLWRCDCSCGDWVTATGAQLLAREAVSCGECGSRAPWTQAEDARLRQEYSDTPNSVLATRFDRTRLAIKCRSTLLGLYKSDAFMQSEQSGRLQPGNVPPNLGKKGMKPRGRAAETTFRPGHRPQTWQPVGTEVVDPDGYLRRKISDDRSQPSRYNWRYVHRLLWEEAHGPIPDGHALVFRNGDKTDIRLENLELFSRVELMKRNSIHNYPPEVVHLTQLRAALNRKINRHERERAHEEPHD